MHPFKRLSHTGLYGNCHHAMSTVTLDVGKLKTLLVSRPGWTTMTDLLGATGWTPVQMLPEGVPMLGIFMIALIAPVRPESLYLKINQKVTLLLTSPLG
ncbi:uncharacterized protein N7473_008703 [Penicillium subrubescens]|uniref:uncharacterized protein n=1 Tax=Penicillium subrubescens TaxID=1316194 RepID=UPI00254500AD|nr:uncharacterized protein N7473_008703 [Penicillium subrubescens]KAJ5886029.1 hypothetical protein N7473_008703 [Penicillium subrubescens]